MNRIKLALPNRNTRLSEHFSNVKVEKIGEIYNKDENTLHINDAIDDWFGISAADVAEALQELDESQPLKVVVNSPGGVVWEAIAIHNMIAEWPQEVTTYNSSMAASAAATIMMVGDKRTMADNARFMVHQPWGWSLGNASEMRAYANLLDDTAKGIVDLFSRKSTISDDEIITLMDGEDGADGTYMNADAALEAGFITSIIDTSRAEPKDAIKNSTMKPRLLKAKIKLSAIDI